MQSSYMHVICTQQRSQAEFPGGGLGQRLRGTVVITYCPGVIFLVSGGYICNYMLSGVISILSRSVKGLYG